MIDAQHHVQLNGVKYRIAEDAEGEGLILVGDSLRPPNTQVVQGGQGGQMFQMRPDILLWAMTDWSGGEGQSLFDQQAANRSWRIDNLEVFAVPGKAYLGPKEQQAKQSDGSTPMAVSLGFAHALGGLWGVDLTTQDDAYLWNPTLQKFGAAANNSVASATKAAVGGVAGDEKNLYYIEAATGKVYTYNATTWALLGTSLATGVSPMVAFGPYLYILDLVNWKLYEMSKATGVEVELADFSSEKSAIVNSGQSQLFTGDDRVYFMQVLGDSTIVQEVTPTTAAGTGFASAVLRYDGLFGEASWQHMGTVYTVGYNNSAEANNRERVIMYWQPGGQYGTLGYVRKERGVSAAAGPAVAGNTNSLLTSAFAVLATDGYATAATQVTNIFEIDAVSGGFVNNGQASLAPPTTEQVPQDFIEFQGQYFLSLDDGGSNQDVMVTHRTLYQTLGGYIESPKWNANLAENKTLTSIQVAYEPLEANTTIEVFYSLDGATYVSAGSDAVDGSTGATYVISTDTAQKTFKYMQVLVKLSSDNSANSPVLTAVNVRAKAAQKQRRWRAMLDCSDDQSGLAQSHPGSLKITNIKTAGDLGTVVDFRNGYENRAANTYEQVDVTIDAYQLILSRAGEGVAIVDLVEVV